MEYPTSKKLILDNSIIFPEIAKLILEGQTVTLRAKGKSMLPFIKNDDIVKLSRYDKLELYDIVLANVGRNKYVLHRIIKIDDNQFTLMGDGNISGCEECPLGNILAVAVSVIKDKKEYDCKSNTYVKWAKIWVYLRPIRKYLLALYKLFSKLV